MLIMAMTKIFKGQIHIKKIYDFHIFIVCIALFNFFFTLDSNANENTYDEPIHRGYTYSVAEEKHLRVFQTILIRPPVDEPPIISSDQIFVPQLTREFKDRYELQFGRTEVEQSSNVPNRFASYEYNPGIRVSVEEDIIKEREFGEYMIRRLTEFHLDKYAKSSPTFRPIYEVKERVSNLNVQVKKGYKLKFHYSLSGNNLDFEFENPLEITSKIIFQMDPSAFGPSSIIDTIYEIGYMFTPKIRVASFYTQNSGQLSIAGYKSINSSLSTSIIGSSNFRNDDGIDNRLILGLSIIY